MVEKIRELCKKQGTSLTKLEQQLGFGNGVIGRWNKSKPSYDRLEKVANALGVAVSDLTGEGQRKSSLPDGRELKKLTPDNFKVAYSDMSLSELHTMMADIMEEIQGRDVQ